MSSSKTMSCSAIWLEFRTPSIHGARSKCLSQRRTLDGAQKRCLHHTMSKGIATDFLLLCMRNADTGRL